MSNHPGATNQSSSGDDVGLYRAIQKSVIDALFLLDEGGAAEPDTRID